MSVWLSVVCHTSVFVETCNIIKLLSPNVMAILRRGPADGSVEFREYEKIATFDQCIALSRKWYKIRPHLLWNANKKPLQTVEWSSFSMAFNDPNAYFKVTPLLDAEYLRNGSRSTSLQWNTNRDLHTPYSKVSFRMTLSDLELRSEILSDTKHRATSLCDRWARCNMYEVYFLGKICNTGWIFFEMLAPERFLAAEVTFKGHWRSSVMTSFDKSYVTSVP